MFSLNHINLKKYKLSRWYCKRFVPDKEFFNNIITKAFFVIIYTIVNLSNLFAFLMQSASNEKKSRLELLVPLIIYIIYLLEKYNYKIF